MTLRAEDGPDGPEVWACVDGRAFARARWYEEDACYWIDRDLVPPELEEAICELEEASGPDELRVGESVTTACARPRDMSPLEILGRPPSRQPPGPPVV